ncbi:MAG: LytR/AlgR family response regulator transcription factor [Cyclobacteriaceae bacterium]
MEKKIRCIIIDDEEPARMYLREMVTKFPELELIGECSNGFEGLRKIQELKPDLVFLDIQMPKLTGLEMLDVLDEKPGIIFITAYDVYAIRAFEQNAIDYLLKPLHEDRFKTAVSKAISRLSEEQVNYAQLNEKMEQADGIYLERIAVKTGSKIHIIDTEDIKYIQASDDYVEIHTRTGEKHLRQNTLKFFEEHLNPTDFVRVHRSFIAQVHQMSRIENYDKDGFVMKLKCGNTVPVSRSGYQKLKEILKF